MVFGGFYWRISPFEVSAIAWMGGPFSTISAWKSNAEKPWRCSVEAGRVRPPRCG